MRRIAFAWVSAVVVGALFASAAGAQAPVPAPLPGAAAEAKKAAEPLKPGLHERTVKLNEHERSYLVYVPQSYDANRPTPVVLCYHGAATNGAITIALTGLNNKADEAGFVVVYPDGTSRNGFLFTWNAGGMPSQVEESKRDDVKFTALVLDDLATVVRTDKRRIFATGLSNGGMMCHRLGVELSDRIAAIASVAGTLSLEKPKPVRPMPVLQIHGTTDTLVPWEGPNPRIPAIVRFRGVDETLQFWIQHDACESTPREEQLPNKADDGTTVTRYTYAGGKQGSEVVLVKIHNGGHTWPGRDVKLAILGKTTKDIAANDLIWDFFQRHPMP